MKIREFFVCAIVISISGLAITETAISQHIWLNQERGNQISVEYLKPDFEGADFTFLSSAWFISGMFEVGDRTDLKFELPLAYAKFSSNIFMTDPESDTMLGNPYVGIRYYTENNMIDFGVRLPFSQDDKFSASEFGAFSDVDRFEAFVGLDLLTIATKIHSSREVSDNFNVRWYAGPTIWIPVEDRDFIDDEFILDYAVVTEFSHDFFTLNAGISGRAFITEDVDDFSDRFFHQLGINGSYHTGNLEPGVHLRFPIQGEIDDIINYVVGLNLIYRI